MTVLGVSLKAYLGAAETVQWCTQVAAAVDDDDAVETFVLPSFPLLSEVRRVLDGSAVRLGAQDVAAADDGAQTGEVLGSLLAEVGCRYVEVGHAERRRLFGEHEDVVAAKTAAALRHGLTPVLCVGEADRGAAAEAGRECVRQLESALAVARSAGLSGRLVVAYEPHWAIGAAEPAPDDHIAAVCQTLRDAVVALDAHPDSVVIYGGSAGPGLLTRLGGCVDGLFLGRFAHDPSAFAAVLDEARTLAGRECR